MKEQFIKPYLVSADANLLLKNWSVENGLTIPSSQYFRDLLKELKSVLGDSFDEVEIISESELRSGLNDLVAESMNPVISLDRTYLDSNQPNLAGYLDVTRTVDENLDSVGLRGRNEQDSVGSQIARFAGKISRPISLLDDVVFDGNTMLSVIKEFRRQNIVVEKVFAGIVIENGKKLLEDNGIEVVSVVPPYKEVIDEICERDFRIGVPYSGRTVATVNGLYGAPYLLPFGKPNEWASIPEGDELEFSLACLAQSLSMWLEIERYSGVKVPTSKLAKPVFGFDESASVSESIRKTMAKLS